MKRTVAKHGESDKKTTNVFFEKFQERLRKETLEHFQEMAAVGEIQGPKTGHYYLEVFSNEYENETPHVTLELPRNTPNFQLQR